MTTSSASPPTKLVERLERIGQLQVLRFWNELEETARARLITDLEGVDLERLADLIDQFVTHRHAQTPHAIPPLDPSRVGPVETIPPGSRSREEQEEALRAGTDLLSRGEVAIVLVAGGQGTRLGFDGPKGTFPIGPVSDASLFQIHAEKIVALGRRHGVEPPLFVMTSPDNHQATADFFAAHNQFGLKRLRLFTQGQLPAVDAQTGAILLANRDRVALAPDGHGGTLRALAAPGPNGGPSCLDEMEEAGIRTIFYFQVDNPLVKIADPVFLGHHLRAGADMSFKVVEKHQPDEKLGVVVMVDGRPQVIEYSDLPAELAQRRDPQGRLELRAGSIAVHAFEVAFLRRLVGQGGGALPFHQALKKVPHINAEGHLVQPDQPNAIKFETFIFDALPLAQRFVVVETQRDEEFEPLKNATGPDSPASVRQRMSDLYAKWLEAAGAKVERRGDGSVPFGIEISPLFALDAADLKGKVPPGIVVNEPLHLR
ncbi:UTP--glucose-1-phosphate uridylyltransferase [Isosphaera pallida ATCC 43644]|uniref:UTP--glucose-1-phosphate uridylyltransferase n=1 Tax=Isosphaera pallida (strain ATCC 43644 / DSM 9630 / IS1B) TaxID=575540 RepID=E8QXZ8_ISOPI|nr:UDPGP type 1 family protein [Isosphaera pallida]ADV60977.1 UTP--glucose-1-phosphate uridylyltransferase [Isosphaera pallida ATCC 43644]